MDTDPPVPSPEAAALRDRMARGISEGQQLAAELRDALHRSRRLLDDSVRIGDGTISPFARYG